MFVVLLPQIAIEPSAFIHHSVLIIYVSLWCFTDEVVDPYADPKYTIFDLITALFAKGFQKYLENLQNMY